MVFFNGWKFFTSVNFCIDKTSVENNLPIRSN